MVQTEFSDYLLCCFCVYSEKTLCDIISDLSHDIDGDGLKNLVNVDRSNILDGGFRAFRRKSFNPLHKLNVRFSGEDGIDSGGLTTEFLRLCINAIRDHAIFTGPENCRTLCLTYKGITCSVGLD